MAYRRRPPGTDRGERTAGEVTEPSLIPPTTEERLAQLEAQVRTLRSLIKPHEKENELRRQSLQLLQRLIHLAEETQWNGDVTRQRQFHTVCMALVNCTQLMNTLDDMRRAYFDNPQPPF